ncbi:MAG: type II toxin-antitoxin system death-on-curing family toxin [Oscillospiraceae bacterium]|nr:type II toxin-antitoxin system death-on-curing family toxin [Oscillospiraceae bacterium]
MIRLTTAQIVALHEMLICETGGSGGIRDQGLLESALSAPFQSYGGTEAYPSIQQKAARLGYGLVKNHAFIDGNKRIGAHAMLVFLALNNVELAYTQEELADIFLRLAAGQCGFEELLRWIVSHQR